MNLKIRIATINDAGSINLFNKNMAMETEGIPLNEEIAKRGVENLFKNPNYGYYLVAELDGAVVGQLMITYEWSDWRNGLFLWIQSVYVLPQYRKLGIYKSLYTNILNEAKNNSNICGIRLYVEKHNNTAREVYSKLGMKESEYAMYETDFVIKR
ncbi:MAG: GNAT family N-acetyltransferase [Bacteroidetes bacterium]|nr:GNAT family N-acetyltransferase [Bacteroidota bacterium]